MRLLCHDTRCEGHDNPAGTDPNGLCRFCGQTLANGYGVLLIENGENHVTPTDLVAVGICSVYDHVWEGHIPKGLEELRGICSRCGLAIALSV